jgi:Gas vesicle synthesis protein GvpL/GvpF
VADSDRAVDALREAIEAVAGERAPGLVAEARAEAESRVRASLTAAFEAALLQRAGGALRPGATPAARRRRDERTPAPRAPRPPERSSRDELGYYVYGVARAEEAEITDDLEGVDPRHSAMLIEHRGLAAIASRVALSEFGEEPLHENLNDVEWLEAKARAHERVLDHVLSHGPVVPMRLCTIYRGEAHVRDVLEREHDVFTDALSRLDGKTEWGVKLIAEPEALERAADADAAGDEPTSGELSAGAAYMREKGRAARRRDVADRIAENWSEKVHDRVAAHAVEALLNPLQNPEVSGHTGDMLLNGVYLVDDRAADEFHAAVGELASEYEPLGARVEISGPWPPYNFVKGSIEAAR